ncbi:MAG: glycosyltransferase family protein [Flavisolibacter sp.]
MKILYAIQGTGNGHITVAREIIPILMQRAEVDILISGMQVDVDLPYPVKYRLHGLYFVFGKKGGIDYLETYKRSRVKRLFNEINELPIEDYDMVFTDFEPVSAWACYLKNKPCIGISHQIAAISKKAPQPKKKDVMGQSVLKYYAPTTLKYGFHFLPYDTNIFTPIIRKQIRECHPASEGHYTVYLPAYSDKRIIKVLSCFPNQQWQVFSKHTQEIYQAGNIFIQPVNNDSFIKSLASADGVLCGGGFQTPSEVLFLKKKLLVIPMKGQYEQQCNGAALRMLGVTVLKNLKMKRVTEIQRWIDSKELINVSFPDETEYILQNIMDDYVRVVQSFKPREKTIHSASGFRQLVLKKVFGLKVG